VRTPWFLGNFNYRLLLAELAGFDSNVISGTGSGKTLAIAIPHILLPDRVSFVISPLK
jgi:hypothetical protein